MDIHQVVTLCRTHRLFAALIYVYTQGLDDYLTPLDDMCKAMLSQPLSNSNNNNNVAVEIGYRYITTFISGYSFLFVYSFLTRLLVYVAHTLAGKGIGDKPITESRLPFIKRELLGYLYTESIPDYPQRYPRIRCLLLINVYPSCLLLHVCFSSLE